jgi:predicted Zn-dependent protease
MLPQIMRSPTLTFSAVLDLLRRALEESPADSTEISWVEALHHSTRAQAGPATRCTLRVRVEERGRSGNYTTDILTLEEIRHAVRQALGRAALSSPAVSSGGHPAPPAEDTGMRAAEEDLFDPAVARLTPQTAQDLLGRKLEAGERGTLDWAAGRVAVVHSDGREQHTGVTCARLHIECGEGPAAGRAMAAARSLRRLDAPGVLERARRRIATETASPPSPESSEDGILVLEPEATADLLLHLHRWWRSAAFLGQVEADLQQGAALDPGLHLTDDPLDPGALPFPFDLRGAPLAPQPVLVDGRCRPFEPALLDENRDLHACLRPGGLSTEELLRRCDGGLSVGRIHRLECLEPHTLRLRFAVGGVRRIRGGETAEALHLTTLEGAFLPALEKVLGIGDTAVTLARGDGLFGGAQAPAVALRLD